MEKIEFINHFNNEEKFWWFKGHRKLLFSLIKRYCLKKNLDILDAGCGTGINILNLQKFGNVQGCDISEIAIDFCKKRGINKVFKADIQNTGLKKESFDLIFSQGVLYHKQVNVEKTLDEFERILKKNGKIIIGTPAMSLISHPIFSSFHDVNHHSARRHNLNDLKKQLEKKGFTILKITYFNFFLFIPILISKIYENLKFKIFKKKRKIYITQSSNYFANYFFKKIMYFESYILKYVNLPFGTTLIVVAEKK